MDRKIISVSKKRQITIPLQFYKHLKLGSKVECSLEDGKIIIQPLHREPSEFSVKILKDLVSQGYSGDELVKQFETQSKNIKKAYKTALLKLSENPYIGQPKRGDSSGVYGFDVKYKGVNYEIAYTISKVKGKKIIVLLAGTRENFYEQLKRYIK